MKLSTAILRGCKRGPKISDRFVQEVSETKIASCALGAALVGVNDTVGFNTTFIDDYLKALFPILKRKVKHPLTGEKDDLFIIMLELNDQGKWSRQKIAKWVKTIERKK